VPWKSFSFAPKSTTVITICEVKEQQTEKEFYDLPFRIYKNDPHWVPHLKQDLEKVFDPKRNKFFRHGELIRYIVKKDGKVAGRVAVFYDKKKINKSGGRIGGLGFFESINDPQVAKTLFEAAQKWLQEKEMDGMDGPINFGEKDKFWGLIIQNFNYPPYYNQNYNPEYYVKFFEDYGFRIYYEQYIYHRNTQDELSPVYKEKAARIRANAKFTFQTIEKSKLEKYAEDFRYIYNRAWVKHEGFAGMEKAQAMAILKTIKPIIDEDLILFAYHQGKPAGFFIALPEINQIFKHVHGNLNWWGKLKFLYHRWKGTCTTFFGLAFGIDPDFQGKGLEGAMFDECRNLVKDKYEDVVITWIGDFNPKMIHVIENLGASRLRTLATYRYLFDKSATFERARKI
jgi:GNAT superfamily N-acetyltransferase